MRSVLGYVALALALQACTRLGFGVVREGSGHADAAPIQDGARDHASPPADSGSVEGPAADATVDHALVVDATVDHVLVLDSAPPGPDAASTGACAEGPAVLTYPGSQMVLCSNSLILHSQCDASKSCEALNGWHLCTAAEYLARGGKTIAAPKAGWIAGCIRLGPTPTAPTNSTCSCSSSVAGASAVSWTCGAGVQNSTHVQRYIGLVSFSSCLRVGTNQMATEGYWQPLYAGTNDAFALCCKP